MQPWETFLVALGGNAALLLLLGWLARSLGSQLLAKDLEKFKADLAAASSSSTEKLRHDLQLLVVEHQVRFSKLHERRAEVIAELYSRLVESHWAAQNFVSVGDLHGDPSKREKYVTAMNKAADFYCCFDKKRIYLPEALCTQIETFTVNMRKRVLQFGAYVSVDEKSAPDSFIIQKLDVWANASEYFDKEIPLTRRALETELRQILAPTQSAASQETPRK